MSIKPGIFAKISADLAASFLLLSRIPVVWYSLDEKNSPDFVRALWAFPLVGVVIGGISGCFLLAGFDLGLPSLLTASIGVLVMTMLTGAMHEDGIADTADGFGGGRDATRKATIMHDSRIGTYGVMALVFATIIRIAIIMGLMEIFSGWSLVLMVATMAAAGRFQVLTLLQFYDLSPFAKLGLVTGKPKPIHFAIGIFIWAELLRILTSFGVELFAIVVTTIVTMWLGRLATRQINGLTGDVMGASVILGEIGLGLSVIMANHLIG